jgi:hypothetical protein
MDPEPADFARERFEIAVALAFAVNMGDFSFEQVTSEEGEQIRSHFESGAIWRERESLFKPLGRFLHYFVGGVEGLLTATLANALNPEDPARVVHVVSRLNTSTKIDQLKRALPDHEHLQTMLQHAARLNNIRNHIAHGTVQTMRRVDGKPTQWGTWLEKNDHYMPISSKLLRQWTRDCRVLCASLGATIATLTPRIVLPFDDFKDFGATVVIVGTNFSGWLPTGKAWPAHIALTWYPPQGDSSHP